jgi:hypothetical protein
MAWMRKTDASRLEVERRFGDVSAGLQRRMLVLLLLLLLRVQRRPLLLLLLLLKVQRRPLLLLLLLLKVQRRPLLLLMLLLKLWLRLLMLLQSMELKSASALLLLLRRRTTTMRKMMTTMETKSAIWPWRPTVQRHDGARLPRWQRLFAALLELPRHWRPQVATLFVARGRC